jgi:hypothetical protein
MLLKKSLQTYKRRMYMWSKSLEVLDPYKALMKEKENKRIIDIEAETIEENEHPCCGDCLCRVCAKNVCGSGSGCEGCNNCTGVVDTEEDCVNGMFELDEDVDDEIIAELEAPKFPTTKTISSVTIAKLIEAHMEGDNEKFLSYANFIADAYEEAGEGRSAKIIRQRIDGTYKNNPKVTLD